MKKFFEVNIKYLDSRYDFEVVRPSSLDYPLSNSVMFILSKYIAKASILDTVHECVIYWPLEHKVPENLKQKNLIIPVLAPRLEFCRFFQTHQIQNLPTLCDYEYKNGSFISKQATLGKNVQIMPGASIGDEVIIGDDVYIGSGSKIVGRVEIGNHVIIRENTVIGADGLTTDTDTDGMIISMPQFGGVVIEDDVTIGSNTTIARGAINDTYIASGCKIDNHVFISHNTKLGKNNIIVGQTILFGSVTTGDNVYISGNATIRNQLHIGNRAIIGMGSVVTRDVEENVCVLGNPAKVRK
ncbi:MAG: hypothetical protein KH431_10455 [Erysipelotrichaceae bacterium]|nr:hypothetical protein [Erysipelotrichaceae bacterium]